MSTKDIQVSTKDIQVSTKDIQVSTKDIQGASPYVHEGREGEGRALSGERAPTLSRPWDPDRTRSEPEHPTLPEHPNTGRTIRRKGLKQMTLRPGTAFARKGLRCSGSAGTPIASPTCAWHGVRPQGLALARLLPYRLRLRATLARPLRTLSKIVLPKFPRP